MSKNFTKDCHLKHSSYVRTDQYESAPLFDNLPEIIKPEAVATYLQISIKTIYDWRYRGKTRNIPSNLFLKINRLLYIRKSVLIEWINSQNKESNHVY